MRVYEKRTNQYYKGAPETKYKKVPGHPPNTPTWKMTPEEVEIVMENRAKRDWKKTKAWYLKYHPVAKKLWEKGLNMTEAAKLLGEFHNKELVHKMMRDPLRYMSLNHVVSIAVYLEMEIMDLLEFLTKEKELSEAYRRAGTRIKTLTINKGKTKQNIRMRKVEREAELKRFVDNWDG